jgi:hypothetical protein
VPESVSGLEEDEHMLNPDNLQHYDLSGVEIRSRVLHPRKDLEVREPMSGSSHSHRISCEEEISAVMRTLRKRFCSFADERKADYLYANPGCGFHVHVGHPAKEFSLQDVKNVMTIYTACEMMLDEIQAPHRINWTDAGVRTPTTFELKHFGTNHGRDIRVHNMPLSTAFLLGACRRRLGMGPDGGEIAMDRNGNIYYHFANPIKGDCPARYPDTHASYKEIEDARCVYSIDAWVKLIQGAPSTNALVQLYGAQSRASVLNLHNVDRPNPRTPGKKTIEFRQASSTTQTEPILSWADFVVKLVWYCQHRDTADILTSIGLDGLLEPNLNFPRLATTVGCADATLNYYQSLLK